MRHALGLEYDGRAFCGFQAQPDGCSVQDALERALAAIADAPVRVIGAGRTDAGVHATSQVVHFDATVERPLTAWVRGVNAALPPAASVLWCVPVPDDFHARFAATARHYTYVLLNRPERPGLLDGRVGWHFAPLDVNAMRDGVRLLVGTHDFSSFRAAACQAKSPIKTLQVLDVARHGGFVRFDFKVACRIARRRGSHARAGDIRARRTLFPRCRVRCSIRAAADGDGCPDADRLTAAHVSG